MQCTNMQQVSNEFLIPYIGTLYAFGIHATVWWELFESDTSKALIDGWCEGGGKWIALLHGASHLIFNFVTSLV